jgi:cytochrome c
MLRYGIAVVLTGLLAASSAALAQERGSAADAKALLQKAEVHYKAVGRDQAFHDFADKTSGYIDRDLYVWCVDDKSIITLHALNPHLIGKDAHDLTDPSTGRAFAVQMGQDAFRNNRSEVDYSWVDPITKKIAAKHAFAEKFSPREVCAVGYFK